MSYQIRRSQDRKFFDHGWLKTYHTFSFSSYYDPKFMGFRDLRVINEDRIAAGHGFPPHDHRDMEIISLVLEGTLAHQDSMGNESLLNAHEVQTMTAGSGITHSEYNPSENAPVHFLQIWVLPEKKGLTPRYQQEKLPQVPNEWQLVASPDGHDKSLQIHQDISLYYSHLEAGNSIKKEVLQDRYAWLQVISGDLSLGQDHLKAGDGVAVEPHTALLIKAVSSAKLLFFDLR